MWSVARRPRWIGMLLLALALAAVFAGLSQWQLSRSIQNGTIVHRNTETVEQLTSIEHPGRGVIDKLDGQLISATGHWAAADTMVISDRLNDGDQGYWVLGHFVVDRADAADAGLPVALGWTRTAAEARQAVSDLSLASGEVRVTGRYNAGEAPQDSDFTHGKVSTVSAAALINTWKTVDPGGMYGGYVVSADPASGLTAIYSPIPTNDVEVNWLNIFYAAEWIVFAGFAIFLWYRLVRDAWEREEEEKREAAELADLVSPRTEVN
jgi:surfeit locus 1 family protein